jgi:hypothetical protein
MKPPLYIYVDVDDTLMHKDEQGNEHPDQKVTEHVCELHREGAILYCWSTGGEDHARSCAQKLGIEQCFTGYLHKPQIFIDDQLAAEWPHFIHIAPDKLRTMEEYRKAVAAKRDGEK